MNPSPVLQGLVVRLQLTAAGQTITLAASASTKGKHELWEGAFAQCPRSADFQVGCIADFQIREPQDNTWVLELPRAADLEIGDTAGLETCATGVVSRYASVGTPRVRKSAFPKSMS